MIQKPGIIQRIGQVLRPRPTPAIARPPSAGIITPEPLDLGRPQTVSLPPGLMYRMRVRAYDPKLMDLFLPDRLAREKGWSVYEQMLDDAQVKSQSTIKRLGPISNGWVLKPADDSPLAQEISQFCTDALKSMKRSLPSVVGDVLLSTFMGLSISEMVFRYEDSGKYAGKIMLDDVQTRPPSVVVLQFDPHGVITGVAQIGLGGAWVDDLNGLNPFKFIIHTYHGRYGSPYGNGDGRAVYKHWWSKDFLMRAWAFYMDRFGAPSMIGRQTDTMSKEESQDFLAFLDAVQHTGYAVLPPDWKVEFLEAPGGAANGQAFLDAIEWHDSQISKAMLGSTMTTDAPASGLGIGGGAVADQHGDTRDLVLELIRADAEDEIVGRQMLKRLVRLNYGTDAARNLTPTISFNPPDVTQATALAAVVAQLITAGVIDPKEPWIRERLSLPAWEAVKDAVLARQKEDSANQADINAAQGMNPDGSFTQPDNGQDGDAQGQQQGNQGQNGGNS